MADIVGANAPRNKRPLVGHAERAPLLSVMIRLSVVAGDEGLGRKRDDVFRDGCDKSGLQSDSQKGIIRKK
jgi:hypothetical protein